MAARSSAQGFGPGCLASGQWYVAGIQAFGLGVGQAFEFRRPIATHAVVARVLLFAFGLVSGLPLLGPPGKIRSNSSKKAKKGTKSGSKSLLLERLRPVIIQRRRRNFRTLCSQAMVFSKRNIPTAKSIRFYRAASRGRCLVRSID